MLIHGLKRYKCDKCSSSFHLKCILNQHKKSHEPKEHICALCLKTFTHAFQLETHLTTHLGSKNFQCDFCGQRFSRQDNLKRHIRNQHDTTEKKNRIRFLSCPIVACRRKFKNEAKFKTHVATHYIPEKNSISVEFGSGQTITEKKRSTRRSADILLIEQNDSTKASDSDELFNMNASASIRNKDKDKSIVTEEDNSTETMDDPENVTGASVLTGTKKHKRRRNKGNRRENPRTDVNGANPYLTNSVSTSLSHSTLTWQTPPGINTHDDAFVPPVIGVAVVKSDEPAESGNNAPIMTIADIHRSFDCDREKELDCQDATGKMDVSNTNDVGSNNEASATNENNSENTPTMQQMFLNIPTVPLMLTGTESLNFPTVRQMLTGTRSINTPTARQMLTVSESINTPTMSQILSGTETPSTSTHIVPQILTGTESLDTSIGATSVNTDEASSVPSFDDSGKEDNTETNRVFERHICLAVGDKLNYECDFCGDAFSSADNLENHECQESLLVCEHCDTCFRSVKSMNRHKCRVTTTHNCTKCKSKFTSAKHLRRHKCSHASYECGGCGKFFLKMSKLSTHECSLSYKKVSIDSGANNKDNTPANVNADKTDITTSSDSSNEDVNSNVNSTNDTPVGSGANNKNVAPVGSCADNTDDTPAASGANNRNDAPVGSGADNKNDASVGSGANNRNDASVGSGANNRNDASEGSSADNTDDAPVDSCITNKNDAPVGSDANNRNDASVGSGANNKNDASVGSGADNKNDASDGSGANNRNDKGDTTVDLDATINWFSEEPALRCTSCDTTFLSREDLMLHECGRNTKDYTHQCLRCFVRFAAKEHLEMHICPGSGFSIGAAEDPVRNFSLAKLQLKLRKLCCTNRVVLILVQVLKAN